MNLLSIYPCSPTANLDFLEATLRKHFEVLKVNSVRDLEKVLKKHALFGILMTGSVREPTDLPRIRTICLAFPKIPCLFYGKVSDPELVFQMADAGISRFVPNGNTEQLVEKLHELKAQGTFRIDLRDFDIDLDQCNFWVRKFIKFVIEDYNFLKYDTVTGVANQLQISRVTLSRVFKDNCWLSPKKLLLCFKNYYAAYLLDTNRHLSAKQVAEICGVNSELDFYKSFKNKTGLTVKNFRCLHHWQDFPSVYLQNTTKK